MSVTSSQPMSQLFTQLFVSARSKNTKKLSVSHLCGRNPPVTSGFPSQRTSNMENVSNWWQHHGFEHYQQMLYTFCPCMLIRSCRWFSANGESRHHNMEIITHWPWGQTNNCIFSKKWQISNWYWGLNDLMVAYWHLIDTDVFWEAFQKCVWALKTKSY